MDGKKGDLEFDVALSYAGEDRDYLTYEMP